MTRFSHSLLGGLALLALAGCGRAPAPAAGPAANTAAPADQISRIVERYWDEHLPLENAISPQSLADSFEIERRYLAEILAVPRDRLDANSRLTYDIFKRRRELAIEGFTFPAELLPMNPFGGMPQQLAALAADADQHPLKSVAQYDTWMRNVDEYVRWTQQAIINMREGMRRGYTSPRAVIERMLPILERLGLDNSSNVFYGPLSSMPETIKDPDRSRLTKAIAALNSEKLLPANRALHDFLQNEYLPRARAGIALSELPLGTQWYAYRVKRAAGAGLSAAEIHRLGTAEVERIGAHLQSPEGAAGAAGAAAPPAAAELTGAYKDLAVQVRAAMPKLFSDSPPVEFDIRAAQPWLQPATLLSYQRPGPADMPPAVLWVNGGGSDPAAVSISGFLEQAEPGHHFQLAIQQQRADLPRFRRYGGEAAFIDGWGLYAAWLGEELGLYPDEAAKRDAAKAEMRCAVAMVVDTGLHTQGWTRTRAFDYLHAHLGVGEAEAQSLIDGYAANPADALACELGEQKIRGIRVRAQQSLGERFDVHEFHSEILKDGAMPLDILEAKMKAWINELP
jgi:uncharacterized protein (DUF885 family)